jgi:hypothetical protein
LLRDYRLEAREEAEAKKIRLEWISQERNRIHKELEEHEQELEQLREMVPYPRRLRALPPAEIKRRELQKKQFNNWASNNDPNRKFSIIRGEAFNALLKVLGPLAHYRQQRLVSTSVEFPSLNSDQQLTAETISHLNLSPATIAGSQLVVRLNRSPLEIQWPTILPQYFPSDCASLEKLAEEFSIVLNSSQSSQVNSRVERWKLFDEALSLMQAKTLKKQKSALHDPSIDKSRRNKVYLDLRDGLRYLESLRVSAERYKDVPADYKVRSFPGGSVEDLLVFCYTQGLVLRPANPGDEEAYLKVCRLMQDYARDMQYVEDWKDELRERIDELSDQDKSLVWEASAR